MRGPERCCAGRRNSLSRLSSGSAGPLRVPVEPSRSDPWRAVAQPGSALDWGSRGRRFESSLPDHRLLRTQTSRARLRIVRSPRECGGDDRRARIPPPHDGFIRRFCRGRTVPGIGLPCVPCSHRRGLPVSERSSRDRPRNGSSIARRIGSGCADPSAGAPAPAHISGYPASRGFARCVRTTFSTGAKLLPNREKS